MSEWFIPYFQIEMVTSSYDLYTVNFGFIVNIDNIHNDIKIVNKFMHIYFQSLLSTAYMTCKTCKACHQWLTYECFDWLYDIYQLPIVTYRYWSSEMLKLGFWDLDIGLKLGFWDLVFLKLGFWDPYPPYAPLS